MMSIHKAFLKFDLRIFSNRSSRVEKFLKQSLYKCPGHGCVDNVIISLIGDVKIGSASIIIFLSW